MSTVEQLSAQFGIEDEVSFRSLPGDFMVVEVNNRHATATIALQGAHVMAYQPRGAEPLIWLSDAAKLARGKSIRGGVPVCWPWFGPHASDASLPGHGHVRTAPWALIQARSLPGGETELLFQLEDNAQYQTFWPHQTTVQNRVTVGATLRVELETGNNGPEPIELGEALHTYFQVGDIEQVSIHGLEGRDYLDKVDNGVRKHQEGPVTIHEEVDRIYLATGPRCEIRDPALQRRIVISSSGSRSTVVWNPWQAKADKMGDLGSDGFRRMLCVETANAAEDTVTLAPGAKHRMAAEYGLAPL